MSKKKSSKKLSEQGKSQPLRTDRRACDGTSGDPCTSSPSTSTSSLDQELSWCVSQLELGLQRKGVSKDQKEHSTLLIRRLQSEKTPLPKKRALMRATFGDYRAKMRESPLPQLQAPQFVPSQQRGAGSGGRVYRLAVSARWVGLSTDCGAHTTVECSVEFCCNVAGCTHCPLDSRC